MQKSLSKLLCLLLTTSFISGCADQGGPVTKQMGGGALGAVTGAILGAQVGKGSGRSVAMAIGAVGGLLAGSAIGASLDRVDQAHMQRAAQNSLETLPSGQSSGWKNPDSGHSGTITPTKTFQSAGRYCREYTQTVKVGGKVEEAYGTACRQPDGSWEVVQQ